MGGLLAILVGKESLMKDNTAHSTLGDIASRRSVRAFTDERVNKDDIEAVLRAAFAAPSAHGKRPFRVAVLEDPATRGRIASAMRWFKPIVDAPVALLVLGEPGACVQEEYWTVDCAAFTQNALLAARSLSLGTVWCGIAPVESNIVAIRSVLTIPARLVPFCAIALGHPKDKDAFVERSFDDTDRVFWNPAW